VDSETIISKENRQRATGHRNPPPMTGVRSSATPKLLCHRHSLPVAIIRSSIMTVLDAPEVRPQKVKRGHRALNVREDLMTGGPMGAGGRALKGARKLVSGGQPRAGARDPLNKAIDWAEGLLLV
jgi:hypothetical protein